MRYCDRNQKNLLSQVLVKLLIFKGKEVQFTEIHSEM